MSPEFMRGVELIGTTISRKAELGELIIAAVLFLGTATYFTFEIIKAVKSKRGGYAFDFALVVGLICCFCITLGSYLNTTTNYVVQVDDSVYINEFTENYNIVGHVNDKYVINFKDVN